MRAIKNLHTVLVEIAHLVRKMSMKGWKPVGSPPLEFGRVMHTRPRAGRV